jgi:hypothetical protein
MDDFGSARRCENQFLILPNVKNFPCEMQENPKRLKLLDSFLKLATMPEKFGTTHNGL